ncbi:MAG: TetR/AcrR family transcriptional regulator [Hyphomonas sp.]|nr:TetR/AcrR family transcriptional regulator [Hyphomonas sp.]
MTELASRAGVSPATPYNLIGTKADLLARLLDEEFTRFDRKLSRKARKPGLVGLWDAVDHMLEQYLADPDFYRALFIALFRPDTQTFRKLMSERAVSLWGGFIEDALKDEALDAMPSSRSIGDVFVFQMGSVVYHWALDRWSEERFTNLLRATTRQVILPHLSGDSAEKLRKEIVQISGKKRHIRAGAEKIA